MSAAKHGRSKRRQPRRIVADALSLAIRGAGKLPPQDRAELASIGRSALQALVAGVGDELDNWAQIVDVVNIAEALSAIGICSDDGSMARISAAVTVLGELMDSREAGAERMVPTAAQHAGLDEALWLHAVQIEHCSLSEYRRAYRRVVARTQAALAGSVGHDVKVVIPRNAT